MNRLKLFDKIMLIILLIVNIAGAVCLGLLAIGVMSATSIFDEMSTLLSSNMFRVLTVILAVFVIFICIRILFVRKRVAGASQDNHIDAKQGIVVRKGEYGTTHMTIDAIQYLVDKNVRANDAIRDLESHIVITPEENIEIQLKVNVMADRNIPDTTTELQKSLKEYMEATTGITIQNVEVLVAAPQEAEAAKNKINLKK